MIQSSRKQREVEQREALILQVAREMLLEHGYLGLRMDQIADRIEYSKGTIYQHFPNKEEIILALANQALEKRSAMFVHAATLRSGSRDRLTAAGAAAELFIELFPDYFQIEQIIRINSVWAKTTEQRQHLMRGCENRCISVITDIVKDAIAEGDMQMPADRCPQDLVFGLWAMCLGAFGIIASHSSLHEIGIADPIAAHWFNTNQMLDAYGWRPLGTERDYAAMVDAVKSELRSSDLCTEV